MLTGTLGIQLPRGFTFANLHHITGGARQAHSLRLRRWLRAQRCDSGSDAVLLGQCNEQVCKVSQARAEWPSSGGCCCGHRSFDRKREEQKFAQYSAERIVAIGFACSVDFVWPIILVVYDVGLVSWHFRKPSRLPINKVTNIVARMYRWTVSSTVSILPNWPP